MGDHSCDGSGHQFRPDRRLYDRRLLAFETIRRIGILASPAEHCFSAFYGACNHHFFYARGFKAYWLLFALMALFGSGLLWSCRKRFAALIGFPQRHQIIDFPKSLSHACGHGWRHSQRAVDFDEVVSEIIQCNRSSVIFDFPREAVRQTRISPHIGPHRPILSFDEARRNMRRVWIAGYDRHLAANALRRRISSLRLRWCTVNFLQHSEVTIGSERTLDGFEISPVTIRSDLHATLNPSRQICDKRCRCCQGTIPQGPGRHKFAVRIDRNPKPHISCVGMFGSNLGRPVLILAINPCPQLIELQTATRKIPKSTVLIIFADLSNFDQQTHHRLFGNSGHSNGRPDGAAFDKAVDNLDAGLPVQPVHGGNYTKAALACQPWIKGSLSMILPAPLGTVKNPLTLEASNALS